MRAHSNLGMVFARAGDTVRAIQHYRQAHTLAIDVSWCMCVPPCAWMQLDNVPTTIGALNALGQLQLQSGQLDTAKSNFEECLQAINAQSTMNAAAKMLSEKVAALVGLANVSMHLHVCVGDTVFTGAYDTKAIQSGRNTIVAM
jgi:Tfp pilus assembly protein PilF